LNHAEKSIKSNKLALNKSSLRKEGNVRILEGKRFLGKETNKSLSYLEERILVLS